MQGNNISLEEIKIARRDFENEEYLKALAILDNLVEKFAKYPFLSLRAALREIVNDLIGAESDLQIENENSVSLRKARLAAKLGKNEEAVSILRRLNKEKQASVSEKYLGIGVAGRRFDLELLNIQIRKSYLPNLAPELKGCAVEHLMALGIYDSCNQLFDKSLIGNYSLLKILREIETADELSGLESKAIAEFAEDEISGINGWLSFDEAKLLASLASTIPKEEEIVEVGSFQGRSACALAMGAKNGYHSHVHSIDTFEGLRGIFPHSTLPAFESNLKHKKLHNFITIHKGTSEEVALHWKGKDIGLLFIDADHKYSSVKRDFEVWLPHLAPNALVAFHDSNQSGPNTFLLELIKSGKPIHIKGLRDSLTIIQLKEITYHDDIQKLETWAKYLGTLGENYSAWITLEKKRLRTETRDLFKIAEKYLSKLDKKQNEIRPLNQKTLVIDITYNCNASCNYCQWGGAKYTSTKNLRLDELLIPEQSISALGIKRVVLSGGEPRLHPEIFGIISYYKKIVNSIIILSNGYGLEKSEISKLIQSGATGIAISLDSVNSVEAQMTRRTPQTVHKQILSCIKSFGSNRRGFELGLNAVVSHITANKRSVSSLLEFARLNNLDYVKFQPIFDDGFVTANSPNLVLKPEDVSSLNQIGDLVAKINNPLTNPPEFWYNLADLSSNKKLSPSTCGLSDHASIVMDNKLGICYWQNSFLQTPVSTVINSNEVSNLIKSFQSNLANCKVSYHCFCTQNLSHIWGKES